MITGLADKIIGVYHFLGDKTPKNIQLVEPRPRMFNPWQRNDQALVAKLKAEDNLKLSVEKVIALLGNLTQAISSGDKVLVKPNFNSPDPFPASTDLVFLHAVVEIFLEAGARVTIGESAGGVWRPTRNVFRKLGLYDFVRNLGVGLIAFEDEANDWVKIKVNGDYLSTVTMPRSAYEADKIVYLPCLKTHRIACYSGALKLAFGFVHPGERRAFHLNHLQQKLAEVSLCWQPNLIIMDGRKAFVSGGPDKGELVEPGLLLASGDLVAIDVEGMKILSSYQAKNKLAPDPWHSAQIMTALKHSIGASENNYIVVEEA